MAALRPVAMLALAGTLLVGGVVAAFVRRPRASPDVPLRTARQLIDKNQFKEAADLLNAKMEPLIAAHKASAEQEREMLRLRGHAIFQGQQAGGQDLAANHRSVIDDYSRLEQIGGTLNPLESYELAWSLASVGDLEKAAKRARAIPEADRGIRHQLVRRIVERDLARTDRSPSLALDLLADLLAEPSLDEADRSWGVARQAELQLTDGHADEAIDRMLRELQRVQNAPGPQRAELHALLGRAYVQTSQPENALKQLEKAESLLEPTDPLRGEVGVMIGRILKDIGGSEEAAGKHGSAKERFTQVMSDFGKSRAFLSAQFGLGEALAKEKKDEEALDQFERVVTEVARGETRRDVTPDSVRGAIMLYGEDRAQGGDFAGALRYALLAEQIYPTGKAPPEVLRAIAAAKKKQAQKLLGAALAARPGQSGIRDLGAVEREEVKRLLLSAGKYYREHARMVSDPGRYAESLWEAADAVDLGGDLEEARKAFSDYVETATDNDPRRPEAKFRLAQVLQAAQQYASAADRYRELLAGRAAGGPWAVRSIVPLAQCLLHDTDPANDKEAEQLLLSAVDGTELGPEADEFRAGLIELGRLLYETKRYDEAIRRVTEAIERYPGDRAMDALRYRQADGYRLSAATLEQQIAGGDGAVTETERQEKDAARKDRLRRAIDAYEQVRQSLDTRDQATLSDLERVQLRNTMFYLGDCAYDLGDYTTAINSYDAARQRYPSEPASLVAMVQIVNAYVEQHEWAKARTANEGAKRHLGRLPADVWSSPDMPMERKHWERWLNSSALLEQHTQAEN